MKNQSAFTNHQPWVSLLRERILCAFFVLLAASVSASPLGEKVQKELDSSPFLAAHQLKISVLDEKQGRVALELTEGPQNLRDMLYRGYDIEGSALAGTSLETEVVDAIRSIKRTLKVIRDLEGVKEISLISQPPRMAPSETGPDQSTPQGRNSVRQEQIQKALDSSPFLAAQRLKMHVLSEQQGSVTLELTEGPQNLRDLLRKGYEINGSSLAEANLDADVIQALRSIRKTLKTIKGLEGVKEISLTGSLTPSVAPVQTPSDQTNPQGVTRSLKEQIQKALDSSPFLAAQQLKMRILSEQQGSVTLELTKGPQNLRDLLRKGYEINGSALAEANLEADVVQALRSIKRTLKVIKGLEGVKEISLTGSLTPSVAPSEILSEKSSRQGEPSPLEEQIQKELDSSPFLAAQQLKMRILSEQQGSVTLELTKGPQNLRDLLRRGYEINGSALAEANLEADVVQALRSIKRTLKVIKGLEGVKEISLTGSLTPSVAPSEILSEKSSRQGGPSPLEEQIQKELDSSPFLAAQQLKMRVLDEKEGVVSLEVTEGPKKLRDILRKGYDINGSGLLGQMNLQADALKALHSVKRTLNIIKGMKGVKEISLTGAINTDKDRAENYFEEATQKMNPNDSHIGSDALQLLIKSAQLGCLRAQTELVKVYQHGVDLMPDEEQATFWLRKAAAQGDPVSQIQIGTRCMEGIGTEKDYKEATAWYLKAANQDLNPDIRTRSQISLASLLATCPVERFRDGRTALEYAKKAVAAAPNGIAIETLAAAYARCGRFEEAIEQEKKWIQQLTTAKFLAPDAKENMIGLANERLQLYQKRKPYPATAEAE